ncbi:MAG: hypothetical protein K0R67_480 [Paenibacillus sp.]|nr:hypothetical protein [Paenibacillus sp.]
MTRWRLLMTFRQDERIDHDVMRGAGDVIMLG